MSYVQVERELGQNIWPVLHEADVFEDFAPGAESDTSPLQLFVGEIKQLLVSELQKDSCVLVESKRLEPVTQTLDNKKLYLVLLIIPNQGTCVLTFHA